MLRRATRPEERSTDAINSRPRARIQNLDRICQKPSRDLNNHDSTVESLRRRYRDLKWSDTNQAIDNQHDHEMQSSEEKLSELRKRREFRESLRLAYLCMSSWKAFVARKSQQMKDLLGKAESFDKTRTKRAIFHAWKGPLLYKLHMQRLEVKAHLFLAIRIKRAFMSRWKRFWKIQCEICRRSEFRAITNRHLFFQYWKIYVERQRGIHLFQTERYHKICRSVITRLHEYRALKVEEKSVIDMFQIRRYSHLMRAFFIIWKDHVFTGPTYILAQKAIRSIPMGSAIRRWKMFLNRRRQYLHQTLQADYYRHESYLRHSFGAWHGAHLLKRHMQIDYQRAQLHHEQYLKMQFVEVLRQTHYIKQLRSIQCENATLWQATRSKRTHLKRWFHNMRLISRFKMRQSQARGLTMRRMMEFWKYWARERLLLQKHYFMVLRRESELTLKSAILLWTNALRIKLKVNAMRVKQRQVCMKDRWMVWLSYTSKTRRHRKLVLQFREKRRSMVIIRSFRQWLGVILRNKCMRRLVRLFQKKILRKKLNAAFQLLNDNRREWKIRRKSSRSRLHRFLTHWVSESARLRVKRSQLVMADWFYSGHRYAGAVQKWLRHVNLEKVLRENERRALTYSFRRILRNTLYFWYREARRSRRRSQFLCEKRAYFIRQYQQQCLYAWNRYTRYKSKGRLAHWKAWKFRTSTAYLKCFRTWSNLTVNTRRCRVEWETAVLLNQKRVCRGLLFVWKNYTITNLSHKRNQARISCFVARRKSHQSVYEWFDFVHQRKWLRQQRKRAIRFYDEYLLYSMLYRWQMIVENRIVIRETTTLTINRIIQTRLTRSIRQWIQLLAAKRELKTKIGLLTHARTQKAMTRWKTTFSLRRAMKLQDQSAANIYNRRQLITILHGWHQYQVSVKALKSRLQLIFQNDNALLLRSAFQWWTKYRSKATLMRIAITHRDRRLRQKVWHSWMAHCRLIMKMKKNILVSAQLIRINTSKAMFIRWELFVEERLSRRKCSVHAKRHYEKALRLRILNGLKRSSQYRALKLHAFAWRDRRSLAKYFKMWFKFCIYVQAARNKKVRANQFSYVKGLKRGFDPWKESVQTILASKDHKSAIFCSFLYWKWTWNSWYRLIEWRKKIERMQAKHVENLQIFSFRFWKKFARKKRSSKLNNLRALQVTRSRNLDCVWRRWQASVLNGRQKNQQLARVLCFYSIDILERRYFRHWQSFLRNRRQLCDKMQCASAMSDHFAVRNVFYRWNLYLRHRKERFIRNNVHIKKIQQATLSRSVQKLYCNMEKSRHLKSCMAKAIEFHDRRYRAASLKMLLLFTQVNKDEQLSSKAAVAFHKKTLLHSSFHTWSAYHRWRNRYHRIVRLFHANKQADYFAVWKNFCALRRRSRAKNGRTMAFWRSRNLRRFFCHWCRFRHLQQIKHRAIWLYTRKLIHASLLSWKRRVHVLRQMQKMLFSRESFSLMSHFASWKRFVSMKQLQLKRLQVARHFMAHNRLEKCWLKWASWISQRREVKKTIQLAVGFRRRFFSWKCFGIWRERVAWWKRKRLLCVSLALLVKTNRQRCVWNGLYTTWHRKRDLLLRSAMVIAGLTTLRQKRLVDRLKLQHTLHKKIAQDKAVAVAHWRLKHQLKFWMFLTDWSARRRRRNRLRDRARQQLHTTRTQRCMAALQAYVAHMKRLRSKAYSFRLQYFRSASAMYFAQWKAFTMFRRQLRSLRHLQMRRKQRHILLEWQKSASTRARHDLLLCDALETRRTRLLRHWFLHWESVGTDQWTFARLIEHHQHEQLHRSARKAVQHWKRQLQLWRNRQQWNQARRQRHAPALRRLLRHWHASCA